MIDHKANAGEGPSPVRLVLGGTPVDQRLADALPELTSRIVSELTAALPGYRIMPLEQLRGEIVTTIEHTVRGFIGALKTGRLPHAADLSRVRETAARRAEERVPLETIVAGYHLGATVCLDFLRDAVTAEDAGSTLDLAVLITQYLQQITAAACAGYLEERQTQVGDDEASRHALLAALLDGRDSSTVATGTEVMSSHGYLVMSLAIGPHADEHEPGVDPAIAARRKVRRLRVEIERRVGAGVLSQLAEDGGIVLVPRRRASPTISAAEWTATTELWRAASGAAGAAVMVGVAAAPATDVASVAEQAAEVRRVAELCGRPPGVYRLDDLLLEYQLTRPGPALDRLAAALHPLTDKPTLHETLTAYLELGQDRRRTARQLHVHPNTVDYRLRKIGELTGMDATGAADIPLLRAALAAHGAVIRGPSPAAALG